MRKSTQFHLMGIAACLVLAVMLPIVWFQYPGLWPVRFMYLDWQRWGWPWSFMSMVAVNLVLFVSGCELVFALRKLLVFQRRPVLGTWGISMVVATAVSLPFCLYPKVTGYFKARHALARPAEAVITYVESGGFTGARAVIISTRNKVKVNPRKDLAPYGHLSAENTRVIVVSRGKMLELLRTLEREGFFEMEWILYPYGTTDGMWNTLEVDTGRERYQVHSYADTAQGGDFDALVDVLRRKHGMQPPPWRHRAAQGEASH